MFLKDIAVTALLLGVLIFVHEFGHFIVAKLCGVKVLRFSIGFGPRIVGFTRGETEYRLAWLPLGGYVKMAGEQPGEELEPEDAGRGFLTQPPWKRALIVFAGPFFNLLFPILVFFFVFLGTHQTTSNRVGTVVPGFPAAAAGIRPGDHIVAVEGQKVATFEEIRDALQPSYGREVTITVARDDKTFDTSLVPTKNTETDPIETVQRGQIGILAGSRPPVLGAAEGSPGYLAGLRNFDRVVQVDGKAVKDEVAFNEAIAAAGPTVHLTVSRDEPLPAPGVAMHAPKLLTFDIAKRAGEGYAAIGADSADLFVADVAPGTPAAKAGIAKGDQLLALNGKALSSMLALQVATNNLGAQPFTLSWRHAGQDHTAQLALQKMDHTDEFGQTTQQLELGLQFYVPSDADSAPPEMVAVHYGIVAALGKAARVVPDAVYKTAKAIGFLFTGKVPFKSVGGPVLIFQLASKTAQAGLESYLFLMAMISINLGLMNLLPIPVLDGFQLLASVWEAIRRRPIPMRAREIANVIGLAMLILLMVMVLKNDITRVLH
jgi:regulator of sigma E protease